MPDGWDSSTGNGGHGSFHRDGREKGAPSHKGSSFHTGKTGVNGNGRVSEAEREDNPNGRNIRSIWTVATQPYSEAHFATFPEDLIKPCILAGAPEGGIVFDPFVGSGTVVKVAQDLGRIGIGMELKCDYLLMAKRRAAQQGFGLFLGAQV